MDKRKEEIFNRLLKAIAKKHKLTIEDILYAIPKRGSVLALAKQELVYLLSKEQKFRRREVGELLHLNISTVQSLLSVFCIKRKIGFPKVEKNQNLDTLSELIEKTFSIKKREIYSLLMSAYNMGYRAGQSKRLRATLKQAKQEEFDLKSFRGVTLVPPDENNAPAVISEAPSPILEEGDNSEITPPSRVKTKN